MTSRVRYQKPGQINVVSILLFAAFVAAAYWLVMFGPAYYRAYGAKEVLGDAAVRIGLYGFDENGVLLEGIEERVRDDLYQSGIDDPDLSLQFKLENRLLTIRAGYLETIKHPFIKKVTVLHFSPTVEKEVGLVNWEEGKDKKRERPQTVGPPDNAEI